MIVSALPKVTSKLDTYGWSTPPQHCACAEIPLPLPSPCDLHHPLIQSLYPTVKKRFNSEPTRYYEVGLLGGPDVGKWRGIARRRELGLRACLNNINKPPRHLLQRPRRR